MWSGPRSTGEASQAALPACPAEDEMHVLSPGPAYHVPVQDLLQRSLVQVVQRVPGALGEVRTAGLAPVDGAERLADRGGIGIGLLADPLHDQQDLSGRNFRAHGETHAALAMMTATPSICPKRSSQPFAVAW